MDKPKSTYLLFSVCGWCRYFIGLVLDLQLSQCPRIPFIHRLVFSLLLGTQEKCRKASSAGEHGRALLGCG